MAETHDAAKHSTEPSPPTVSIRLKLCSNVLRRSDKELISLIVTTQLSHCSRPVTLDHFEWFDLTTGHVVEMEPHEGLCDPGDELHPHQVVTLRPGSPLVTSRVFDPISPLCDPVRILRSRHEYRIRLRPQQVWWVAKTAEELFGDKDSIPVDDLPDVPFVRLESADELRLKVED